MYTVSMDAAGIVDDPIRVYLREVRAVAPLTQDEEIELSQHILAHDERAESASRRLVEANLSIVVSIAERCLPEGMYLLDLV
jgi:RNA polymerase primary sigma factor